LLFHVVAALHAACGLSGSLDRREQKTDQNADDRDDDQKFDEGKPSGNVFAHKKTPEKKA
jgi:hypothetical protein